MSTVTQALRLNDGMTPVFKKIQQALNLTIDAFERMNKKVKEPVATVQLNLAKDKIRDLGAEIKKAEDKQKQLNENVKTTTDSYSKLGNVVKTALGAIGVNKIVGLSDKNTQIAARLKIMTGGSDEQIDALQSQIFESAQNSRADYFATADVVSKLGLRAGDAFGNTNDIIQFSENLNKMFVIAGASQEEMSSASLQLTQALGSGVLRGEELNAVFEAAPNIIQTIADYMDVPIGRIRAMAAEGEITADIIKNAILDATRKIDQDFSSMPMTWGQVWTMTVNKIIQISQPLLDFISFLAQNWATLEPIVLGVAAAIGTYVAIQTGYNIVTGIGAGLDAIHLASKALKTGATIAEAAATKTAEGAQIGLNAALLACPITWIVIAVVALVAVLIYLWNTNDKVANALIWAWDMVQLGIMQFGIGLKTIFFGALDIIGQFKVGGLTIIDGFINGAIDLINGFITILNKIPGVSIDLITNRSTMGKDAALEFAKEKAERDSELLADADAYWKKKNELDATRDERVANRATLDLGGAMDNLLGDGLNVGNVANVENVEGEVNVASEDLKLLRELAEQQYIQNYISNAPVVNVATGDIHENADVDYLIEGVASRVREEIDSSMEGVPVG